MDFRHSAEVMERENLFIPSGFDTLNLISELVKGQMLIGPSGEPLLFEDVITVQQANNMAQGSRVLGRL